MSVLKQALPLVTCEDGKMILHEEVAKKVFESKEARNRPVAIISIAGVFRKGKSFFLNFVLRYLKAKTDPNWLKSECGPIEGFDWEPNLDGVTSGITIWHEVFVVKEVAIVLIDTQGLFEPSKSTAEDTYIMVLSFLFSSFQILNHYEYLNASDLKNFELFAKYGMALGSKTKSVKGFQNLLFLVRDWKHESRQAYGLEGGKQYLDVFLKKKMNEELRRVHETFSHCEKVECFLMPHPGPEVAQSEKFAGEINLIDKVFLDNMKTLVEHLIDSVKPKKMLSLEANGENLLHVMKQYVEYINARELPEPKSLLQLQIELLRKEVETKCMKIYNNLMLVGTNANLLNKTKMDKLHTQCADKAIAEINKLAGFVNEEQIETSKSEFLQVFIANKYMHYKTEMEAKVENKLQIILKRSKSSYKIDLVYISRTSRNVADFCREASNCREKSITVFQEQTNFGDTERIERLLESLQQFQMELLRKEVKSKCLKIYKNHMRVGTNNDKLLNKIKMDELHTHCADAAIVEFTTLADFENQKQHETSKSEFLQVIEQKYMDYKETMRKKIEVKLREILKNSKSLYNSVLSDISEESILLTTLKKKASKHREKELADFLKNSDFGDRQRIKSLLESLQQYMDESYDKKEADFLATPIILRMVSTPKKAAKTAGTAAGLAIGAAVVFTESTTVGGAVIVGGSTIGLSLTAPVALAVGAVALGVGAVVVVGATVFESYKYIIKIGRIYYPLVLPKKLGIE